VAVAVVFLPLLAAAIAGFFGRAIGFRASQLVTCGAMLVSMALGILLFTSILTTEEPQIIPLATWIRAGGVDVEWALRLDTLSGVMILVVTIVSAMVHVYSIGYMAHDPGVPRFMSYLSLFTFFMLMLVTAELILIMLPPALICLTAACVVSSRPSTLTSMSARIRSASSPHGGAACRRPALLTRPSIRPNSSTHWAISASAAFGSVTECLLDVAIPPSAVIAAATASAPSMSLTTTDAPDRAAWTANASPRPRPAPVTTTALPSRTPMPPVNRTW